jgi:ribosomal protein L25 (general stress protein Ctc)
MNDSANRQGTNAGVRLRKLDLIILILYDQGSHKIHANLQRKVSGKDPSCMSEDFTHVSD